MRQHRRLVAAAGTDLERLAGGLAIEDRFDHARHDVGVRNGLAKANRQRVVLVGAAGERLLDENMARHHAERGEHPLVADALGAQPGDHARAGARRGHADAGNQRSSQARARGSWAA